MISFEGLHGTARPWGVCWEVQLYNCGLPGDEGVVCAECGRGRNKGRNLTIRRETWDPHRLNLSRPFCSRALGFPSVSEEAELDVLLGLSSPDITEGQVGYAGTESERARPSLLVPPVSCCQSSCREPVSPVREHTAFSRLGQ